MKKITVAESDYQKTVANWKARGLSVTEETQPGCRFFGERLSASIHVKGVFLSVVLRRGGECKARTSLKRYAFVKGEAMSYFDAARLTY